MTPKRQELIKNLVKNRQVDIRVVLEHVYDLHNVGAVVRTCDAVGVPRVHMTLSPDFKNTKLRTGKYTSAGARKWVDTVLHPGIDECIAALTDDATQIIGTTLSDTAISIYDIDFTKPTIIIMGNEKSGLSEKALSLVNQHVTIPQKGMVQSLNISVACAITLYEMMRQRLAAGMYDATNLNEGQGELFRKYVEDHNRRFPGEVEVV
jgi:tRNA (guanosine-2'-O-)-methyltransferase